MTQLDFKQSKMTTEMNPVIDRMLGLTADIAEELLVVKDVGSDSLPEELKLKIISLAELAATVDTTPLPAAEPDDVEAPIPQAVEAQVPQAVEAPIPEAVEAPVPQAVEAPIPQAVEAPVPQAEEEQQEVTYEVEPDDDAPCRNIDSAEIFRAFSINDAFLYRREIFGGSRQRFMDAVEHVSTLPDRQALQEYLVESLGLNLNKTPGKEFYRSLAVFF